MACTAKCDSCKSSCIRPAESFQRPTGDRRRPIVLLTTGLWFRVCLIYGCLVTDVSGVVPNLPCLPRPLLLCTTRFVVYNSPAARFVCPLRSSERPEAGQCTVMATHHQNQPPPGRISQQPTAARSNESYKGSSGKRHRPGRVMVCLTRARLHTTKRDWQRTVEQVVACRPRHPLGRDSRHMRDSHLFCNSSIG